MLHRALEPLQAATLIVESSPGRPDVFALIDAVSRGHGGSQALEIQRSGPWLQEKRLQMSRFDVCPII